jgi:hypothetical protein
LFLLYICTYIPLIIQGVKLVLFADDTNIILVDKNEDALQQKMLYVMKELDMASKTDLIINIEKTVATFFHSNQFRLPNKPLVVFNNIQIVFKPGVRF